MILGHGQFTLGLSERQMSIVLDALDNAVQSVPSDTVFDAVDFAETRHLFNSRFAY